MDFQNQRDNFFQSQKQKIFIVFYQILSVQKMDYIIAFLFAIIQLFQILYFPFQEQLRYVWKSNTETKILNQILECFTLMKYVENQNYSIYLAFFYICVGSINLAIIIIILLAQISNKQKHIKLGIKFLSILLQILTTIAFEPIQRILLGFLACSPNSDNILMMNYVKNQQCWIGYYNLHAVIAIITYIEYILIVAIYTQLCIESKRNDFNIFAQKEGLSYLSYYSFIFLSLLSYSVLEKPQYTIVIIIIQFISSFHMYYNISQKVPFINQKIQQIWTIISAINFWTEFMLLYSYILEQTLLNKTIIIWMIGVPFCILIVLFKVEQEIDLISSTILKNQNAQIIININDWLLQLIENTDNKKASLILDGYLQLHEYSCDRIDCILIVNEKLKGKFSKKLIKTKKQLLLAIINQLYIDGIFKFPTCVKLKLNYCYFLFDYMQQYQSAFNMLQQAELCSPSLNEEFFIYRYKQIIEDQIQKQQKQKQFTHKLDLITEKTIKEEIKKLRYFIEDSSMEYLIFWSQLLEDIPNLMILYQTGRKILQSLHNVEKQFNKIQEMDPILYKIHNILHYYYQQIVHDESEAESHLMEMKRKREQKLQYNKLFEDVEYCSDPILVLTLETGKPNTILNLNKAITSFIGFSKTDLINKSIEMVLPQIYVEYNKNIVEYFVQNQELESEIINIFKERLIMMKSKTNYIVPCFSTSQVMNSIDGFVMLSKIRKNINYKQTGYLLIDKTGKIKAITSSCEQLLGIDFLLVQRDNFFIQYFFPNILFQIQDYLNKQTIISIELDTFQLSSKSFIHIHNFHSVNNIQFICCMYEVETPYIQQGDKLYNSFGYVIKLDELKTTTIPPPLFIKKKKSNLGFKFYVKEDKYKLEIIDDENNKSNITSDKFEDNILWEEPKALNLQRDQSNQSSKMYYSKTKHSHHSLKSYYESDIKTLRLINSKIIEIEEIQSDNESQSISKANYVDDMQEEENKNISNLSRLNIINRKQLISALRQSILPSILIKLSITIQILFLMTLIFALVIFILLNQIENDILSAFSLVAINNQRITSLIKVQTILQDLKFYNLQLYPYIQEQDQNFVATNKQDMLEEINLLKQYQLAIQQTPLSISSKYQQYLDQFENTELPVLSLNQNITYFTLKELIDQLISTSLSLYNDEISQLNDNNQNLFYFNYNLFNSAAEYSILAQNLYYYNLFSQTNQLDDIQIYLSCSQLILIIFTCLLVQYFLNRQQNLIKEILTLFLEIDEHFLKKYQKQTRNFIGAIRISEDEQMNTLEDEFENETDNEKDHVELDIYNKRRRKTAKFSTIKKKKHIVVGMIILLGFSFYYFYNYIIANTLSTQTQQLSPLLNLTTYSAGYYLFMSNAIYECFYNSSALIFNSNCFTMINISLTTVEELNAIILNYNQQSYNILTEQYNYYFTQAYITNACLIPLEINNSQCTQIYDGILQQGLSLGLTKVYEGIRILLSSYQAYDSNTIYNYLTYNLSANQLLNFSFNIINTNDAYENRQMVKIFIKDLQIFLALQLRESVNQYYDNLSLQMLIMFIVFWIYSFVVYTFIWLPTVKENIELIQENRYLLSFIPIETINKIQQIQGYIQKSLKFY